MDVGKPKVPACIPCNSEHGRNEQFLLTELMLCFDEEDKRVVGIPERALRAIDPNQGTTPADRAARAAELKRIKSRLRNLPPGSPSFYPFFRPEAGADTGSVGVEAWRLHMLGEKIVRGISLLDTGLLIPPSYSVSFHSLGEKDAEFLEQGLAARGSVQSIGPGFIVRSIRWSEPIEAAFQITIWERLRLTATVEKGKIV
jgi:hypothetical protein